MRDTTVSNVLTQFGAAVGMPDLDFNTHGECHLLIDGRYLIQIALHPRDFILMSCPLGNHTPDAHQLNTLLQANYGQVAGGIILAQSTDGRLCAQLCLPCVSASVNDLLEHLEALIVEAERWDAHFMQNQGAPASVDARSPLLVQPV